MSTCIYSLINGNGNHDFLHWTLFDCLCTYRWDAVHVIKRILGRNSCAINNINTIEPSIVLYCIATATTLLKYKTKSFGGLA